MFETVNTADRNQEEGLPAPEVSIKIQPKTQFFRDMTNRFSGILGAELPKKEAGALGTWGLLDLQHTFISHFRQLCKS